MRYLIFLLLTIYSNFVYSSCIDDPYEIITDEDLRSAVYCLHQEITILKNSIKSENKVVHVVQVIATGDNILANEVRETFNVLGYQSFVRTAINTDNKSKAKTLYRVMIGPYSWKHEANDVKNTIRKKYKKFNKAFVTSVVIK